MKRIGIITYHSAYNYGACLQAYALQQYIKMKFNNVEVEIINFRTQKQKYLYSNYFEKKGLKNRIKSILIGNRQKLIEKNLLFENFINKKLIISKEFTNSSELVALNYDIYICGSDQIWNPRLPDFDYAYFFDFLENQKRISYAASFGSKHIDFSVEEFNKIKKFLMKFDGISLREDSSLKIINEKFGIDKAIKNIDPTMLLDRKDWEKIISDRLIKSKYAFFYDVKDSKRINKIAKEIGKKLNIPVVISRYQGLYSLFLNFKKKFNCGPEEFLNYIYYSELVITSSFHGVVFAALLNKPFIVINGLEDNRINDFLINTNFTNCSIDSSNQINSIEQVKGVNYSSFLEYLEKERKNAYNYFKKYIN